MINFIVFMLIRLAVVKQGKDERKSPSARTWTTSMEISIVKASRCGNIWRKGAAVQSTGTGSKAQPMTPKRSSEEGLSPAVLATRRVHSHMLYMKIYKQ